MSGSQRSTPAPERDRRATAGVIRVGIAGCGRIARRVHMRLFNRIAGAQVVAVADHTAANLALATKLVPLAKPFPGLDEMLAGAELDAVVVCLPTDLHAAAAESVFAAGKHLYLESPLAENLSSGRRVLAAWRDSGAVGMVGLNPRFHPLVEGARRRLAAGEIGRILAARTAFSSLPNSRPMWAREATRGGGPFFDKASHEVDMLRFVLGLDVEEVFAQGSGSALPDTIEIGLRFTGGCVGQILVSNASVEDARFDVYGAEGMLAVDRYASLRPAVAPPRAGGFIRRLTGVLREMSGLPLVFEKLTAPADDPSFRIAFERFVAAIRGEAEVWPDLAEGFRSLAVVVAAHRAMIEGRPVTPETEEEGHGG